ncbi:MAG: aldo/keto reductase [Planctomycetota bacterium]|nr:aldo/keto reductase [Planctomycetota bacterium]
MEHRQLGSSNVEVSVITFGAWAIGGWAWGAQDENDALAAMDTAIDMGVTSIDTAPVYGFGLSEEFVGRAVAGKRDKVQILTKYGMRWDSDVGTVRWDTSDVNGNPITIRRNARKDSVIEECENSLKRLGTDYIDLFQCHWRDESVPVEETMEAMNILLNAGKIRAAGVSNFSVQDMDAARLVTPIASNQPPYSMINRGIEKDLPTRPGSAGQAGILPYCQEHNIGILAYSPLQRGLLTGKITENYQFGEGDHRPQNAFFRPENVRKINAFLAEIRPIAEAHNATLAQLAINWTIHRPGITVALVGARNAKQAAENAKAADFKLTDEETNTINALLDGLELEV